MIIKNIVANRKRNLWLLLEMVIITIVTWIIIDPVVVLLTIEGMSQGYEKERLVNITVSGINESSPKYSTESSDSSGMAKAFDVLINRILNTEGVESATPSGMSLDGGSSSLYGILIEESGDTTLLFYNVMMMPIKRDYFTTHGIQSAGDSPSVEYLSNLEMGEKDVIITEDLALKLFGNSGKYIGKEMKSVGSTHEGNHVVGVVKTVRPWQSKANSYVAWHCIKYDATRIAKYHDEIIVRLKEGYSPSQWVRAHKEEMLREYKAGNIYISRVITYTQKSAGSPHAIKSDSEKRLKYALLVFFLLNLGLGVAGLYYFQTRRRSHDAGLMKSYGATKGTIFGMLVGEALTITFTGWIAGCLIYLHFALEKGLSAGLESSISDFPSYCWVSNFWSHYAIVSAVVLAVLSIIVFIGVCLPAYRIAQINPVDALRQE